MPHEILQKLFDTFFPKLKRKLTRTITVPVSTTLASQRGDHIPPGAKVVPYISFETVVGRNSAFPLISEEQLEVVIKFFPFNFRNVENALGNRGC